MMLAAWEPAASSDAVVSVPDEELVGRFQAGDLLAFDVLIQRYTPPLYKFAIGLVGKDHADDLVQETLIKAYQKLPEIPEEIANSRAWFYQVAKHFAIDQRRHDTLIQWLPWQEHKEQVGDGQLLMLGPEQAVEEADLIESVMAQVAPKFRPCVYLDIFEEMKQRDIALLLGVPERTVRRYIAEGKEQLREAYKRFQHQQGVV